MPVVTRGSRASGDPGSLVAPIMSMLMCATICSSATGELPTKCRVPHNPCSSPLSQMKISDRFDRGADIITSAIDRFAALPDALSSAEL